MWDTKAGIYAMHCLIVLTLTTTICVNVVLLLCVWKCANDAPGLFHLILITNANGRFITIPTLQVNIFKVWSLPGLTQLATWPMNTHIKDILHLAKYVLWTNILFFKFQFYCDA
jgi:hypothetical protein